MKQLLPPANATLNIALGTITFATTIPSTISHILHVTNVTRGVIYFQPQAGLAFTGTYASPVLTLTASTAGHNNADKLEIFYDDGLTTLAITGALTDTQLRASAVPVSGSFSAAPAAANNNWAQSLAVTNASTSTIINIASSTAGYKINGFVGHGTGDGLFFLQIGGITILSGRTRSTLPTLTMPLPNPISVTTASVVALKVTNESGSTADYEATLLGS